MKFYPLFLILLLACTPTPKTDESSTTDSTVTESTPTDTIAVAQAAPADETAEQDQEEADRGAPGTQNKWEYKFYGFSADLSTTAFEATGPNPGPDWGIDFCIVSVDKNDYAQKPYREPYFEGDMESAVRQDLDSRLAKFKLPVTTGFTKVAIDNKPSVFFTIKGDRHYLSLSEETTNDGEKIFELRLYGPGNKLWILQMDTKLPASRGPATAYRLKDAYVQGPKFAVIIEYDLKPTQDAESYWYYTTKYMIVTGSVNNPPLAFKTVACKFESAESGDCYYMGFSCGDFGGAEKDLSEKERALWNDLTIDGDDGSAPNPAYVGKEFDITYATIIGRICGDPSGPEFGEVKLVRGFKVK